MLALNHSLMAATAAVVVARVLQAPAPEPFIGIGVCTLAALLPDIDEPQSAISRRMPLIGCGAAATLVLGLGLSYHLALAPLLSFLGAGMIGGALLPVLIKRTLGHRGIIHHPFLGAALVVTGCACRGALHSALPLYLAIGWCVHLLGDAATERGLPLWGTRRLHLFPRKLSPRAGSLGENLLAGLWAAGCLTLALAPVPWLPALWTPMQFAQMLIPPPP